MADRYPGYDVLRKRDSPSWNEKTRRVIDERLATDPDRHNFFTETEWPTVGAVCARIVPQPADRVRPVPLAAMLDAKLSRNSLDGYRDARLPSRLEAWRRGLAALDAEAAAQHGRRFHELEADEQNSLLKAVQEGRVDGPAWGEMPPALFFAEDVLNGIVTSYYSHPVAWNEIGFGGPASPRGYVRLNFDRRDPWEAAEARPGQEAEARRKNARVG